MQLSWLGHSCFKLEAKADNETVTVIIDPFSDDLGLTMPKVKADLVLVTHDHFDHNNVEAVKGEPKILEGAGEYEVKKLVVYGVPTYHDNKQGAERGLNTCFRIDAEGLTIVHLGDLGHILTAEQLEFLEGADILLIPVGGRYTLDAKTASEVVSQIEPRIVIPMHYKMAGAKVDLDPVENFLKEMGVRTPEKLDKLKISKKDLMTEDTKVILLERS
ncbi:MAG: MBL fold metallo-hydrolase [Patescibacteria group bacterium]|jgi:L-ascorbate metabolism protein UlaG (beta-lactamase superfamily)